MVDVVTCQSFTLNMEFGLSRFKPFLLSGLALCLPAAAGKAQTIDLFDAIHLALAQQASLELQEEELFRIRGQLMEAGGPFDFVLQSRVRHGVSWTPFTRRERRQRQEEAFPPRDDSFDEIFELFGLEPPAGPPPVENFRDVNRFKTHTTQYSTALSTLTRSGISGDVGVEFSREYSPLFTNKDNPPRNQSRLVVGLNIPLLRGLGNRATAAAERALTFEVDAARESVAFSTSEVVLETTSAFWNTLAALEAVRLREDSLTRASDLLNSIERLVEADEVPPAVRDQARANLAERRIELLRARADLVTARHAFGRILGLSALEIRNSPLPTGTFPEALDPEEEELNPDEWILRAFEKRPDLRSRKLQEQSALALRQGASANLLPRLDLRLEADYVQVSENTRRQSLATPFRSRQAGPGGFIVVDMDWPMQNRSARGQLRQQQAVYRQARLSSDLLTQQISADVASLFNELASNSAEIENSREAVELYRQALRDEEQKFQMGMATIIDVIQTQERLTGALFAELDSRLRYALNLANFRFATGDILGSRDDHLEIDLEGLNLSPFRESSPRPE